MEKVKLAVDSLIKKHRSSVIWLGGDFNLPDICWETQTITGHQNSKPNSTLFLDLEQDNNFNQVVTFPTRKDPMLDLFLTNQPSLVNRCQPLSDLVIIILYTLILT